MGKIFAVVLTLITLVSVAFFVMHTWWLPVDISTTGPAVDHQLEETLIGTGVLFLAGAQLRWVPHTTVIRARLRHSTT